MHYQFHHGFPIVLHFKFTNELPGLLNWNTLYCAPNYLIYNEYRDATAKCWRQTLKGPLGPDDSVTQFLRYMFTDDESIHVF